MRPITVDTLLLDLDGVLVDNVEFEQSVTRYLVRNLARVHNVTFADAMAIWNAELRATRRTLQWYSYDYHCLRLGLEPLARDAHNKAAAKLRIVPGAKRTLRYARDAGIDVVVTTDAERWVAELKLRSTGLTGIRGLAASPDLGVTKSMPTFWRVLIRCPSIQKGFVIDNRVDNLVSAAAAGGSSFTCVLFDHDEHVTRLGHAHSPHEAVAADGTTIPVVTGHRKLVEQLRQR